MITRQEAQEAEMTVLAELDGLPASVDHGATARALMGAIAGQNLFHAQHALAEGEIEAAREFAAQALGNIETLRLMRAKP